MSELPPLAEISPFDPRLVEEPFDYYRQLREEAPVHRDPNTHITMVSSYELVTHVLRSPEIYSNRFGATLSAKAAQRQEVVAIAKQGWPPVDTMLTADPPEQKRFRSLVNKAFTARRVNALDDRIEGLAHELIDTFASLGRAELISEFTNPLPLTIIAEQLGVPRSDLPRFRVWAEGFLAQLGQMATPEEEIEGAKMIVEFQHYFAKVLDARRDHPQDDIISDLVHARVEGERPLDTAESLSILQQLLVAGHETTSSAIAEGMLLLIRNPDQLANVQRDPSLIPNMVEEVLRLASPTSNMWRVAKRASVLGGVTIPEGGILLLRFGAANRDAAVFRDAESFDVERENAADHLAFGQGLHFCVGAMLARKEMEIAFRVLLERLEGFRLAADAAPPRHRPSILLRGLAELWLEFAARSARSRREE